jgi:hypothetical protein
MVPTCAPLMKILYRLSQSAYPERRTSLSMQVAPADIVDLLDHGWMHARWAPAGSAARLVK